MSDHGTALTTGLPGLDRVLKGILPGDNIVWQVDTIGGYLAMVEPFCQAGLQSGRKVVYFRFASHPPLVGSDSGAEIPPAVNLVPPASFESRPSMKFIAGLPMKPATNWSTGRW